MKTTDYEIAALSCVLQDAERFPVLLERTGSFERFTDPKVRRILTAMKVIVDDGHRPDIILTAEVMRKAGDLQEGDVGFIAGLIGEYNPANFDAYCNLMLEGWAREGLRLALEAALDEAGSLPPGELASSLSAQLEAIAAPFNSEDTKKGLSDLTDDYLDAVAQSEKSDEPVLAGAPTGFGRIDRMTSGFTGGALWVLGAYPAQGKSALALQMAMEVAKHEPVFFYSLEMSKPEIISRMVSAKARISTLRLRQVSRHSPLDEDEWIRLSEAKGFVDGFSDNLLIQDDPGVSVGRVAGAVDRFNSEAIRRGEKTLRLVVIDYLQLMDLKGESSEQAVAHATKNLKRIALKWTNKGHPLSLMVLSQLTKPQQADMKKGVPPRPNTRELRGSGQIHADADVVAFIYRVAPFMKSQGQDASEVEDLAEFIIAKQRNGPVGVLPVGFHEEYSSFFDTGF